VKFQPKHQNTSWKDNFNQYLALCHK